MKLKAEQESYVPRNIENSLVNVQPAWLVFIYVFLGTHEVIQELDPTSHNKVNL